MLYHLKDAELLNTPINGVHLWQRPVAELYGGQTGSSPSIILGRGIIFYRKAVAFNVKLISSGNGK